MKVQQCREPGWRYSRTGSQDGGTEQGARVEMQSRKPGCWYRAGSQGGGTAGSQGGGTAEQGARVEVQQGTRVKVQQGTRVKVQQEQGARVEVQ